jgi:hypothetical protein
VKVHFVICAISCSLVFNNVRLMCYNEMSYDIKANLQLKSYYLTAAENITMTAVLLNGEGGIDKRQAVVHIVSSSLPFKVSTACVTFVTVVLIVPPPEHFQMTLVRY